MFKRRRSNNPIVLFLSFFVLLTISIIVDRTVREPFFNIAEARAIQLATEAINKTLQEEVSEGNLQYKDFVVIEKDGQGRVTLIQANTVKVNKVAAESTLAVQKTLENLKWQAFEIPLGQVLGISILANYGPRLKVIVYPVGTVKVSIVDKFESAGINQTRHSIYLAFNTSVRIVIPSKGGEAAIATQVPLAESIIVGVVPSTYVSMPNGILGSGFVR